MSQVSTWVQGTDAQYYKNPVIEKEGFFICFDDEEDPEIVVAVKPIDAREGPIFARAQQYRLAADHLKSLNIPYKIAKYGLTCERLFGEFTFRPAFSVYFHLKGPLPVEIITEHEGRAARPKGECTFLHFIGDFPK